MDLHHHRRTTKAATIANLNALSSAYTGDADAQATISEVLAKINSLDAKPIPPAVGSLVIGDAVNPAAGPSGAGGASDAHHQAGEAEPIPPAAAPAAAKTCPVAVLS